MSESIEKVPVPLKPKGVRCPEGIWSPQAALEYYRKKLKPDKPHLKSGEIVDEFLHFLVMTPALDVFTINSSSGTKSPIDRDYLRSETALRHFVCGRKPFDGFYADAQGGEYIFIDRVQFDDFLAGKPIIDNKVKQEKISIPSLSPPNPEKHLSARERETVCKIIIGMAIKGYSYDPKALKSPTAKEVSDDLSALGIYVSDDTIRKWLKEAAELLPPAAE